VDDDAAVREGLALLIATVGLRVQAWADPQAFLAGFDRASIGAIVLDVRMPGTSGLVLFERLAEQGLSRLLPVIFLTGHGDVPTAVAAVKRGAFDFVEKPFSNNALVDRVEQALAASAAALTERRAAGAVQRALAELTEREREVMRLVIDGKPNKLIADALAISVRTVEVHRARVFDKMNVKSAVELANLLRDAGI
jgi:two-component system response regulator DctR